MGVLEPIPLLKPSMLLDFCLELYLVIVKPLTLLLNLMHILLSYLENHCLIPLFTNNWLIA